MKDFDKYHEQNKQAKGKERIRHKEGRPPSE